ncbi:hypothetical protein [Streptomyces sp.]|uniref:hypothetical protein n=1 Tax=Streptomyces sp. TaxID=1931 RepID=UPI002F4041BD
MTTIEPMPAATVAAASAATSRPPLCATAPWLTREERDWFTAHLREWLGAGASIPLPPTPRPFQPSPERAALSRDRRRSVPDFFRGCLRVYRAVLDGEVPPAVGKAIYGGCPPHLDLGFHRRMGTAALTVPQSFRTDESMSGKLFEIQVPGSGWGEYLLLSDFYAAFRGRGPLGTDGAGTVAAYVDALRRTFRTTDPCLLHLLDTSTAQTGMRYFIQRARGLGVRYFGWDSGIGPADIQHVKSHSWQALFAAQHHDQLLARAAREPALYDTSTNWMFFTKVVTALPFWRLTADFFTDQDRSLFPYTAIVEPDGVQTADGEFVSRKEFTEQVLGGRRYFLKYAGGDLYRGSTGYGVHVLDAAADGTRAVLDAAWEEVAAGTTWIVQEAVEDDRTWGEGAPEFAGLTPKLSVMCSLGEYLGSMILVGEGSVVHARSSRALTVCAEPLPASPPDEDRS